MLRIANCPSPLANKDVPVPVAPGNAPPHEIPAAVATVRPSAVRPEAFVWAPIHVPGLGLVSLAPMWTLLEGGWHDAP